MPTVGSITLTFADSSTRDVPFVNARAEHAGYDRTLFRAPYGAAWHATGTRQRAPETVRLAFEVWDEHGITRSTLTARALTDDLHAAVTVTLPWGSFTNAGVMSITRSPIVNGYRMEVVMATTAGVTP